MSLRGAEPARHWLRLQARRAGDVAIYLIEPALARRDLKMLLFLLILQECLAITIFVKAKPGPGSASLSLYERSVRNDVYK